MSRNRNRILLIDGNNLFVRNFSINPSLDSGGIPVGGVIGCIRSINKLCRTINPDNVVFVWDGQGGSLRRRQQVKEYKEGRKPPKLNRMFRHDEADEKQNKIDQQIRLIEYLNYTPVVQFMIEQVEADDVIAWLSCCGEFTGQQKVIISNDKDFFQLVSAETETVLLRPVNDEIMTPQRLVEAYDIHPTNFALARAVAGDTSDNLRGVPRVGLKSLVKSVPLFSTDDFLTIENLLSFCQEQIDDGSKAKTFSSIIEYQDTIETNYRVMNLSSPLLSFQDKESLRETLRNFKPAWNKTKFVTKLARDGFGIYDLSDMYSTFKRMSS